MSSAMIKTAADNALHVEGELNAYTVVPLIKQGEDFFENKQKVLVDLHGVTHSDSTGLALLAEWVRFCRRQ